MIQTFVGAVVVGWLLSYPVRWALTKVGLLDDWDQLYREQRERETPEERWEREWEAQVRATAATAARRLP